MAPRGDFSRFGLKMIGPRGLFFEAFLAPGDDVSRFCLKMFGPRLRFLMIFGSRPDFRREKSRGLGISGRKNIIPKEIDFWTNLQEWVPKHTKIINSEFHSKFKFSARP